jgi:hypothetical protein
MQEFLGGGWRSRSSNDGHRGFNSLSSPSFVPTAYDKVEYRVREEVFRRLIREYSPSPVRVEYEQAYQTQFRDPLFTKQNEQEIRVTARTSLTV